MTSKFITNDLVWAKMKYFPAWPAKVVDPPTGKGRKNRCYVYFYGSNNYGWIKVEDISLYKADCPENFNQEKYKKNKMYIQALNKIKEIYHEEVQLNSPTYKRWKAAEQEDSEESVHASEASYKGNQSLLYPKKQKRTKEEEEERRKKIQHRLKVKLFPKKRISKDKKCNLNKRKNIQKDKKSKVTVKTSDASPSPGSCIPTCSCVPVSCSCIPPPNFCIQFPSSRILTINVRDYKKLIPHDLIVLVKRCKIPSITQGYPTLTKNASEKIKSECPPDQPPTLQPEL